MRKFIAIAIIVFGFFFMIKALSCKDEIRVRVVPSSNEKNDLVVKEEVMKITINYLEDKYDENMNRFISNIKDSIEEFNKLVSSYNAKGELIKHKFIQKEYDGVALKDETVLTFLVLIDKAKGDNWWGIIYPQFLEVESSDVISVKSYFYEKYKKD